MNGPNPEHKTILIGIGNDGRGDDALGWLFADQFADNSALEVVYRYQLQVEDAALIGRYDCVVFADAGLPEMETGFCFQICHPVASVHFSTHRLDPATVLWLAKEVCQASTNGYVMAIQGYEWGLRQGLSARAAQNLKKAVTHFREVFLRAVP
ncbi:MAG: hydrogenase maturation protease [Saprospiraceae bacterium]|nr:hydrogenase maturation protease [Saprospiraceae bacterium]